MIGLGLCQRAIFHTIEQRRYTSHAIKLSVKKHLAFKVNLLIGVHHANITIRTLCHTKVKRSIIIRFSLSSAFGFHHDNAISGARSIYRCGRSIFKNGNRFNVVDIAQLGEGWKTFILLGVIFAAWAKSAQLPFYMWLPSAMEAPTPVSAYLHGASMVKVGVAVLARELMSAGAIPEAVGWVIVIGAIITCIFSFIMYLPQTDMKRLLAFSTISQLSYIFLAFGFYAFGSGIALEGGIAHIFNHAFAKTLFFLTAGAFSYTLGTRMLPQLRGVLKKQPLLGVAFAFAALAIAGVPPMNGFFSKTLIFAGCSRSGRTRATTSGSPLATP